MISMSGYGKGLAEIDGNKLTIELKSVNHRFLDLNIKLPRAFNFLEERLRNYLKERVARGHIDVYVNYECLAGGDFNIECNHNAVTQYVNIAREIATKYNIPNDITVGKLLSMKEVIIDREIEPSDNILSTLLGNALTIAVDNLIAMRTNEGEKIKCNTLEKLELLKSTVSSIETYAPVQVQNYKDKLVTRIQESLGDVKIDEAKLMNEIVFYADKVATDEEFIRLYAHIEHFKEIIKESEPIGRKLDFIVQEMNRESNTIGSKCSDLSVTNYVVILKTEIEKIREQMQNIE